MTDELDKKEEQESTVKMTENEQKTGATSFSSAADIKEVIENSEDKQQPESELEKVKKERDEYLAGWQRAKADFLNYQKDEKKRLEEFLKFCEAGLIVDLLPVLDSFDLALAQIGEVSDPKFKGFFLIKSQLEEILKKKGLELIKSVGEKFNPELHEAVAMVEAEGESQTIIEEIQKGYKLNGRVLRPSKVKIIK